MNRRNFVAGILIGGTLTGIAFFAGAAALQSDAMPGLEAGEQAFTGENLAFVTSNPVADVIEGRFMVQVDGEWRDVQLEPTMMPAD